MTSKITAIERARAGSPLTVYVDDVKAFTVSEEMVIRLGLEVGLELAADDVRRLEDEGERRKARDAALRLLAVRARSRQELIDRLVRKGFETAVATAEVDALGDSGLVDDGAFARLWADERTRLRPVGPFRLRRELAAKGVPGDIIEETLEATYEAHPEAELARCALARRAAGADLEDRRTRARLHAFLVRRGFSHEAAAEALNELRTEDDE